MGRERALRVGQRGEGRRAQIEELFRLLDDDDDGALGRAEMRDGLERLSIPVLRVRATSAPTPALTESGPMGLRSDPSMISSCSESGSASRARGRVEWRPVERGA